MKKYYLFSLLFLFFVTSKAQTIYSGKIVEDHGALIVGTTLIKTPNPYMAETVYYDNSEYHSSQSKVAYHWGLVGLVDGQPGYIVPEWITTIAANAVEGYATGSGVLNIYLKRGANIRIAEGAFGQYVHVYFYDETDEELTKIPEAVAPEDMKKNEEVINSKLYNIQGMKINEPQEGQIYILNGQKYMKIGD